MVPVQNGYDAIVVGAGPAGATAAFVLARAGVRTLMLDRARFPRSKPCGGAITTRVLGRFPYLESALGRISTHWISALHLEGPDRTAVELRSSSPAVMMVRRWEFDALLVSLARDAGAEIAEGADVCDAEERRGGVELRTRGGERFRAAAVVAADGVHGVVARRLRLTTTWNRDALAIDMMEEAPHQQMSAVDPSTMWVSYGFPSSFAGGSDTLREGYAYVFPKQHHVNVGIGYLSSQYRRSAARNAYALQLGLVEFLKRDGVLRGESRREHFTPFLIPVGGPIRVTGTRRVVVAGDAGGFVNGFTAEGIYHAMVSGELAAQATVAALRRDGDANVTYTRSWRRELGAELQDATAVRRYLFGGGREGQRVRGMIRGAGQHPELVDAIVSWATGRDGYARLRRRLASGNPILGLFVAGLSFRDRLHARVIGTPDLRCEH